MQQFENLEPGCFYHVYNRGLNHCDIFVENRNYEHFLRLYSKYIDPIADTFAWCLMKNHFHLLIRINVKITPSAGSNKPVESSPQLITSEIASKAFSNLFNAYAQAFNKSCNSSGKLFESPFKRIQVTSEVYFRKLVYYIHHNPVKHGFTDIMIDYPWSSYQSLISVKPTKLRRNEVIGRFDNRGNFIEYHRVSQDFTGMGSYFLE